MIVRAKTFENWMKANFTRDQLRDMWTHGADAGWNGLTWYSDTTKLYERYKDEIWDLIYGVAEDHGYENPLEYLTSLKSAKQVTDVTTFENAMVWIAAELIAYQLTNNE